MVNLEELYRKLEEMGIELNEIRISKCIYNHIIQIVQDIIEDEEGEETDEQGTII